MPPALDRLLASPSALRLLRTLATAHAPPTAWLHAAECVACICPRRSYATGPPDDEGPRWRRWKEQEDLRRHVKENLKVFRQRRHEPERVESVQELVQRLQEAVRSQGRDEILKEWILRTRIGFELPTDDTREAEVLWGTFIKDPRVVVELLAYAADLRKRTGHVYPRLYELCIAHWLPKPMHHRQALAYHQFMRRELQLDQLPLQHLVRILKRRLQPAMYDTLLEIYKDSSETNLYDEVVPRLRRFPAWALAWHAACILKGDLPSPDVAATPMVRSFIAHNATSSIPEVRKNAAVAGSLGLDDKMDQALLRRLRGQDTAPVRFEDSFCARMFATRAVPPESVIRGLALVGVNEIGPLAVRAMASRTDPISELSQRFEELRASGIALQGCVFSLALESFAEQKQHLLVQSMLESDQHPEVYDNAKLQTELLNHYLEQHDWNQAHRTLAILSLFHQQRATRAWNLLLQSYSERRSPSGIVQTLQSMAQCKIAVESTSLVKLKTDLLPSRHRGHHPGRRSGRPAVTSDRPRTFDDLRFVARVYLFILERDMAYIHPLNWREILRRFGMAYRLRELRRLVQWLCCWYTPRGEELLSTVREPVFLNPAIKRSRSLLSARVIESRPLATGHQMKGQMHRNHPLRLLFPDSFKQALVVWGFRAGLLSNATVEQSLLTGSKDLGREGKKRHRRALRQAHMVQRLSWDSGLKMLTELRDLGLHVSSSPVVTALKVVFVNLFGRGRSRKIHNRMMEAANKTRYEEYVRRVNEIWGRPLLVEPRMYGRSNSHSLMWHPRFDRVVPRRSHLKLQEIVSDNAVYAHQGGYVHQYVHDKLEQEPAQSPEQGDPLAQHADPSEDPGLQQLLATFEAQTRAMNPDAVPRREKPAATLPDSATKTSSSTYEDCEPTAGEAMDDEQEERRS
ncbi:uncharacterized protein CC84DRAFT_1166874 [Paraphaeosphaeria sporulosa]|uniref:Uncharacterized protein n=1 Tax=Paraphaeosphaeria sporulosa TaxID=1460663 RepID=A0A177C668_9PLEO|nr:uncharacterized protein CC84DRAFT_1166874 [Paraphaeosphaeria sporulosa]OAG03123.1 hypothetical protein CC84DRAFT_1166874 [Paraphaeosphaeria sporulosa]